MIHERLETKTINTTIAPVYYLGKEAKREDPVKTSQFPSVKEVKLGVKKANQRYELAFMEQSDKEVRGAETTLEIHKQSLLSLQQNTNQCMQVRKLPKVKERSIKRNRGNNAQHPYKSYEQVLFPNSQNGKRSYFKQHWLEQRSANYILQINLLLLLFLYSPRTKDGLYIIKQLKNSQMVTFHDK